MYYQTFEPSEPLQAFVKCYWILEDGAAEIPQTQRIVPDGCMEMIFHYGDLYKQYLADGTAIIQPRCFVFGQLTRALEIEATGKSGIFAIRFHPGGLEPLLSLPINELENRATALDVLFGESGADLENRVLAANSTDKRVSIIEEFLWNKLSEWTTQDRIVQATVETILQSRGQLTVVELSEQIQVNRRQLERKFSSAIGLSPKQLSKIIRLQATLRMLANNQFSSLTDLAYQGEYYDQAHFIKDFKEFTGMTPKDFYSDNLKMSALFSSKE